MRTSTNALALAVALAALWLEDPADACGPSFPPELLAERGDTLFELEPPIFLDEVGHLVPAPAPPYPVVDDEPADVRTRGTAAERALYDRGATAFKAGHHATARAAFTALLELPRDQRLHRSTWAAFMLGRSHVRGPEAIAAFRRVRALARDGFVDELGLASASLGREALASDRVAAIHLYAEQAANGDPEGGLSLLVIARAQARERDPAVLADPVGQRLLATYALARSNELATVEHDALLAALAGAPGSAAGPELAAATYRAGKWDLARTFARRDEHAPLARWVLAKLALRDGDTKTAERLLAGLAAEPPSGAPRARSRIQGERAILALAGDRPLDAMAAAWDLRLDYPLDPLYIAERVLFVDELIAFVDGLPLGPELPVALDEEAVATTASLRQLLARRLVRAGRYLEAVPYFAPHRRTLALKLGLAYDRARLTDDPIERARALFEVAEVTRHDGLELLGTEGSPDWRFHGAQYDPAAWDDPETRALPWTSEAERRRVQASAPAYPKRYHYRYLASALAEHAADLLPHRSQAFAATLCHATRYIFMTDAARRDALYQRYLAEGPRVDFAGTFGQECPAPEFERARRFLDPPAPTVSWRWRFVLLLAAGLVALALACWRAARRWL
jgi:hypothetical protein